MAELSPTSVMSVGAPQKLPSLPIRLRQFSVFSRLLALAIIFAGELLVISVGADGAELANRGNLLRFLAAWGPWILRFIVGFAALFVTFGYLKSRATFDEISEQLAAIPIRKSLFAAHFACMVLAGALTFALYKTPVAGVQADLIAVSWLVAGAAAIAFGGFAVIPLALWIQMVRGTGYLWLYTSTAVVAACVVGNSGRSLWRPMGRLTFSMVEGLLRLVASGVTADPVKMIIGTGKFKVEIAEQCSGFEGAGLILAFGVVWLWLFRKECRFPQALLLVPAGVVVIYLLNAVRIAALVLIGSAGARDIAVGGFHSQAGWIAFNVVALGFSVAARRMPYFTLNPPRGRNNPSAGVASDNPTAAYLVPFLVILGAGMFAGALSGTFRMAVSGQVLRRGGGVMGVPSQVFDSGLESGVAGTRDRSGCFSHLDRTRPLDGCSGGDGHARCAGRILGCREDHVDLIPSAGRDDHRPDRRGTRLSRIPSAASGLAGLRVRLFHTVHMACAGGFVGAIRRFARQPVAGRNPGRAALCICRHSARQNRGSGGRPCDYKCLAGGVRFAVRPVAALVTNDMTARKTERGGIIT